MWLLTSFFSRTNAEFLDFVKTTYLPSITDVQLTALSLAYPEDPAQVSGPAFAMNIFRLNHRTPRVLHSTQAQKMLYRMHLVLS